MHKSRVIPLSLQVESGSSALLQRVRRHALTPWALPTLFWKNIRYAYVSRRPEYWNERGRHFATRGHYEQALACYDHALTIKRDVAQVWANRGRALSELDRLEEAEANLREAVRLKPDFANAYHILGTVLDHLGRFDEAETSVRTALRLHPQNAQAYASLGYTLYHRGRAMEAEASYRAALRLRPDVPEYHAGLGLALLLAGRFEEGWQEFEWRWQTERFARLRRDLAIPSWDGAPIGDRTILLIADQGQGDTLQFCRYVPRVAARAKATILAVHPSLVRLLSRLPGVTEITVGIGSFVPKDGQPSPVDLWCGLMSLPFAVGATPETIPPAPYLAADPADVAEWRGRLAGLPGLRVGLCWAGEHGRQLAKIAVNRRRSLPLSSLAPLGEIPGVQLISLQKGPPAAEAACPPQGMRLLDLTEHLHDFADTAALMENLDLVISIDTAVAHLAGALGKPVWVLNRFDTCFRWPRDRDDSPWYSSLRQFRQPTPGDWQSVISRAREALRGLAAGDRGQLRATGRRG